MVDNDLARTSLYKCPAVGCEEKLPFEVLACPKHLSMLPQSIRDTINKWWSVIDSDLEAIGEYMEARHSAIIWLKMHG